ncbi:MAG: anti-sigma factor antagonist [bacterium]
MPDRVQMLLSKLKDSDSDIVRASIVEELGHTGDHRAIRPLIEELNNREIRVRYNAIKALGGFGEDAMVPLLRALDSPDHFMRRNVIQAIGEIASTDAVQKLISMLMFDESDREALIQTINALGRIGDDRAVEPLLTMLKSNDWETKWRAIHALGRIGDSRAIEPLLDVHNDADKDLQWAAAMAVERIKTRLESPGEEPRQAPLESKIDEKELQAPIKISHQDHTAATTIRINGELAAPSLPAFMRYVDEVLAISSKPITLDLSECTFMDSFALGHLNSLRKKMKDRNLSLTLRGMKPSLRRIFEVIQLDKLFDIKD